ncbi:MAG: acyl--CoA ligase, partial [Acidobacteria bacterium]
MALGRIAASFDRVLRDRGPQIAIEALSEGRTLSFDDIADCADQLRRAFEQLHLEPGRPVALLVGNHSSFLPLLLACLRLRFVVLPLDGDSPLPEATRIATAYEAQAMVALQPSSAGWLPLPAGLGVRLLSSSGRNIDFAAAALLKLTSGSTDVPKAVLCTEDNLWHDGEHVVEAMGIDGTSVQLGAIPLAHSYALGNLVLPLLVHGARLVLRHGFIPPAFCRDVERCGVTVFAGVPFMFDRMIGAMGLERLPHPLRTLITAGAPIDPATVLEFERRLQVKIHSFYGSSETGGIAYDASDDVIDPLTVGTVMPGVSVSLVEIDAPEEWPDDTPARAVPLGQGRAEFPSASRHSAEPRTSVGRVIVRSRAVALGYAGDSAGGTSDEVASPLRNGEFVTADIGRFDEQGRLFLIGRLSPAINVAGRKVQPEEVERVLLQMPEIARAAVLGVPDRVRGERLVACVVPAGADVTPMAVRRHCARHLSPHKIPRAVVVLEALPLT